MSGYFWDDRFFEDEEIRKEMNNCLDKLVGISREFAIYRFGLDGQKEHSLCETAEYFSISTKRVKTYECSTLRKMGIRMPNIRSSSRLNDFLKG